MTELKGDAKLIYDIYINICSYQGSLLLNRDKTKNKQFDKEINILQKLKESLRVKLGVLGVE